MRLINANLEAEITTFVKIILAMRKKYSCYLCTKYGEDTENSVGDTDSRLDVVK